MYTDSKLYSRCLLSWSLIFVGSAHFWAIDEFVKIMPPYLPFHTELVMISGVAEMTLGISIIFEATRKLAAWGMILLFIAVFPANINMLMTGGEGLIVKPPMWSLWLRLPLQGVLIYWAYTHTKDPV